MLSTAANSTRRNTLSDPVHSGNWEPFLQACLEMKINPEPVASKFFNNDFNFAHYSLGHQHILAIAKGFHENPEIVRRLDLTGNRLTADSVDALLAALTRQPTLRWLSFAENDMAGAQTDHLAAYLMQTCALKIRTLDLHGAGLGDRDADPLLDALVANYNLRRLDLARNHLRAHGAESVAKHINGLNLRKLDVSWNDMTGHGIEELGRALCQNICLKEIDFSYNRIGDSAGQMLASCLVTNSCLEVMNLTNCGIGGKTAVVFGKSLCVNKTLKRLILSLNNLTEIGGRSIMRAVIIHKATAEVTLSGCSFQEKRLLDQESPEPHITMSLGMGQPYDQATLMDLCTIFVESRTPATMEVDQRVGKSVKTLKLKAENGVATSKGNAYKPPSEGTVQVRLNTRRKVGGMCPMTDDSMERFISFMRAEPDSENRANYLHLVCRDVSFTTEQAQQIIDQLGSSNMDGTNNLADLAGENYHQRDHEQAINGLRPIEIMAEVWPKIRNSEKLFEFLLINLRTKKLRTELAGCLSVVRFGFNVTNATGHYALNLMSKGHREIFLLLAALQQNEITDRMANSMALQDKFAAAGEKKVADAKYFADTSQNGRRPPNMPYSNFRNEKLIDEHGHVVEGFKVDNDFMNDPKGKLIEFDYVSTTRPPPDAKPIQKTQLDEMLMSLGLGHINPGTHEMMEQKLYFLACLRLATTGNYFRCAQVVQVLDIFQDPHHDPLKVPIICCFFSRIVDLENFHKVINCLPSGSGVKVEAVKRLGILNIMNPLDLFAMDYELDLTHRDERVALQEMMRLGHVEEDNLDKYGECDRDLTDMNAMISRLEETALPGTIMRLRYRMLKGARNANWDARLAFLHKTLVGTLPLSASIERCLELAIEMKEANFGGDGTIHEQYAQFEAWKRAQEELRESRSRRRDPSREGGVRARPSQAGRSPRPGTGVSPRPGTGVNPRPGTGASPRPGTGVGPGRSLTGRSPRERGGAAQQGGNGASRQAPGKEEHSSQEQVEQST